MKKKVIALLGICGMLLAACGSNTAAGQNGQGGSSDKVTEATTETKLYSDSGLSRIEEVNPDAFHLTLSNYEEEYQTFYNESVDIGFHVPNTWIPYPTEECLYLMYGDQLEEYQTFIDRNSRGNWQDYSTLTTVVDFSAQKWDGSHMVTVYFVNLFNDELSGSTLESYKEHLKKGALEEGFFFDQETEIFTFLGREFKGYTTVQLLESGGNLINNRYFSKISEDYMLVILETLTTQGGDVYSPMGDFFHGAENADNFPVTDGFAVSVFDEERLVLNNYFTGARMHWNEAADLPEGNWWISTEEHAAREYWDLEEGETSPEYELYIKEEFGALKEVPDIYLYDEESGDIVEVCLINLEQIEPSLSNSTEYKKILADEYKAQGCTAVETFSDYVEFWGQTFWPTTWKDPDGKNMYVALADINDGGKKYCIRIKVISAEREAEIFWDTLR